MAKNKIQYECQLCGKKYSKWEGKCFQCGEWNTISEIPVDNQSRFSSGSSQSPAKVYTLSEISVTETSRFSTYSSELDRVLGGGIVKGAAILIGGEPGIGKSTLLLELASRIASKDMQKVLYISGEESLEQIKLRAARLGVETENLLLASETSLNTSVNTIKEIRPAVCIIDSIQAIYDEELKSPMGSFSQLRQTVSSIIDVTKLLEIPVFLVGHVTKEGMIAGPKLIEHLVDAVIYFEGEENINYRMLRTIKNRFGPTNEIGIFEMKSNGLEDVENPSSFFLSGKEQHDSGSVIGCIITGTRPILIEIQSLISSSYLAMPRRTVVGYDANRVAMLLALMEKKFHYNFSNLDLFVNIVGGLKVAETSLDLAIMVSIASSYLNKKLDNDTVIIGEVGLSGEVRKIPRINDRITESLRLGFERIIFSEQSGTQLLDLNRDLSVIKVKQIYEVFDAVF